MAYSKQNPPRPDKPWPFAGPPATHFASHIVEALGGRWTGRYALVRCPAHHDRTPSLAIARGEGGKVVVHCHAGCAQADVIAALRARGLWPGDWLSLRPDPRLEIRPVKRPANDSWKEVWARALDPRGTQVERYLAARRVGLPPAGADAIRYHPELLHNPSKSCWPAMVAAITDAGSGEMIGIHRTFLGHSGCAKAPVPNCRMVLGSKAGGVVRLVEDAEVGPRLGLAEGIETALTAVEAGWSCWAAIDAGNFAKLPVWPWIDLTVFADNDEPGRQAAFGLVERWRWGGGHATVRTPSIIGADWNDRLQEITHD